MKIKQNIPNAITCGNLLCGCLALVQAFEGNLVWAAYLVGIAAVLDFFDGFLARMLNVTSAIGKDLDSLADMVTFGVVPAAIMYQLLLLSTGQTEFRSFEWDSANITLWEKLIPFSAFLISIFSAIRLAKFNNDERQKDSFIGLPTPAAAIFFCSLPLILSHVTDKYSAIENPLEQHELLVNDISWVLINNPGILLTATCLLSFLLVSPIPLFALKFKDFGFKGNEIRYIFLGISLLLLVFLQFVGIPLIILFYIVLSVLNNLIKKS